MFALTAPLVDAAKKATFVYVHDSADASKVFAYALGPGGGLTELDGSPYTTTDLAVDCRGNCQTMAYSTRRKVLLTANEKGITTWTVGRGGGLTRVGGPFHAPEAIGITVVNIGKHVYVYAARNPGAITAFELEKDGTLTFLPGFPFAVGTDLIGATSVKRRVMVVDETTRRVYSYAVRRGGSFTEAPDSPYDFSDNGRAHTVQTDSRGRYAIVGGADALELRRLKRNGHLDPLAAGVTAVETTAENGTAVSRKGLVAVIPVRHETGLDDLEMFKIGKNTLSKLGATQSTGMPEIDAYVFDATGKVLVAASRENDEVRTFMVDKAGRITAADTAAATDALNVTDIEVVRR